LTFGDLGEAALKRNLHCSDSNYGAEESAALLDVSGSLSALCARERIKGSRVPILSPWSGSTPPISIKRISSSENASGTTPARPGSNFRLLTLAGRLWLISLMAKAEGRGGELSAPILLRQCGPARFWIAQPFLRIGARIVALARIAFHGPCD
jgi:hypothetical protein